MEAKIGSHALELWTIDATVTAALPALHGLKKWLSEAEVAQSEQFKFAKDQYRHVLGKCLQRYALSRYLQCEPATLQFSCNEHGKPQLVGRSPVKLSFNLSHTQGCIVLAVCAGRDVGVDVEGITPTPLHAVATAFTQHEQAAIQRCPALQQNRAILAMWTLKEAVLKAQGQGLTLPLDSVRIGYGSHHVDTLTLQHPALLAKGRLQAWQICLPSDHMLAVASFNKDKLPITQIKRFAISPVGCDAWSPQAVDCELRAVSVQDSIRLQA